MASAPRISLEQWRALQAVVDAGGYAQAAAKLHKSQSAITYAVQKIETLLKVKLFAISGRKARLTGSGEVLYQRAKGLLEEAESLEGAGRHLAQGWESELRLAVEIIFPTWLLLRCFELFAQQRPETRIELYETVLSGTDEALIQRRVELAICSQIPPGFMGDALMPMRFIPAAHPNHPLHQLKRKISAQDLRKYRQPAQPQRAVARFRTALDLQPQGDADPRRRHGARLRLVRPGYDPHRTRAGAAQAAAAARGRRAVRRAVPDLCRSRLRGSGGAAPGGHHPRSGQSSLPGFMMPFGSSARLMARIAPSATGEA